MTHSRSRITAAGLGLLVLSSGLGATSARAAERGGLYLYQVTRPNGVVMVVDLYGYETNDAKRVQQDAFNEATDDWNYGAREWADLIPDEPYPVPKPLQPEVKALGEVTGTNDAQRAAFRDPFRAALESWAACEITDLHGNAAARAIRSDHVFSAEMIEMTVYARAVVRWADAVRKSGEEAAGARPQKPALKKLKEGFKTAAEAKETVDKANADIAAARQKAGLPPPDANPPSLVKSERVLWPGLKTIYHGANWGGDETFVTAIREANYGASGCAEWQVEQCTKRGLESFVFLWAHEAGTIPAKFRDDDAVLCYYLGDRIKPNKWGFWAGLEAAAYAADPQHPAVFSMSPEAWGGIEVYFPIVRGRAIEYYHYHWDGNRKPHYHFVFLELYRQHAALNGDLPIVRLLETRVEDLRKTGQTVFTSLAYGVRGFQFGGGLFDGNQRDERGVPKPNDFGKAVAKINQAIKVFSPVFKHARSVDVFQTAPLPPFGKEAPTNYWVRPSGAEVVLGEFADRYNRYFVLANRDAFNPHDATLTFAQQGLTVSKMNKDTGAWEELTPKKEDQGRASVTLPMEAGGGDLLRVAGHYDPPTLSGRTPFIRTTPVRISAASPGGTIHYTLDGSEPTAKSPVYKKPIELSKTATVRAVFVDGSGQASAAAGATFTNVPPRKFDGKTLGPGVAYEYYEGAWTTLPAFDELKPAAKGVRRDISLAASPRGDNYALRFTGYLDIQTPGSYTFTLGSDDGSRLTVNGEELMKMDGIHGVTTQSKAVELKAGWQKVELIFFQGTGGVDLKLQYEGPGVTAQPLSLWCEQ